MPSKLFITGTDTGIGKTTIAAKLLNHLNERGHQTIGVKPVSSGCEIKNGERLNEDALTLQSLSTVKLPYSQINPLAFEPPIAPHLAAREMDSELTSKGVIDALSKTLNHPCDIFLIEGVGGWLVPLNASETMADFVRTLKLDVLLVVGMRLGCLNHALLTAKALKQDGVNVIGWIANCLDPDMLRLSENISTLQQMLPFPFLGTDRDLTGAIEVIERSI